MLSRGNLYPFYSMGENPPKVRYSLLGELGIFFKAEVTVRELQPTCLFVLFVPLRFWGGWEKQYLIDQALIIISCFPLLLFSPSKECVLQPPFVMLSPNYKLSESMFSTLAF